MCCYARAGTLCQGENTQTVKEKYGRVLAEIGPRHYALSNMVIHLHVNLSKWKKTRMYLSTEQVIFVLCFPPEFINNYRKLKVPNCSSSKHTSTPGRGLPKYDNIIL